MKLIKRTKYLDELNSLMNTPDIKVITGVRRSGKSKLMDDFAEEIKKKDKKSNVIHINFNITEFEALHE
jgi:predicted AAA+ superfamily ATPase